MPTREESATVDEFRHLVRSMRSLIAAEREAGLVELPGIASPLVPVPAQTPPSARDRQPGPDRPPGTARPSGRREPAERDEPVFEPRVQPLSLPGAALAPFGDLPARVAACTTCRLHASRTRTVFGEGCAPARLVFCGEGPGFEEDRSGRPFVGRAGELLSDMIVKGMKLRREDVFILNAVKCRPPENRAPAPDEIAACRPYLLEQLAVLRPSVIVALGNAACTALLGKAGIMKIRGQVFDAHGAKLVPTYHPAYLLRNPEGKRDTWADLQLVMRLLAVPG